MPSHAEHLAVPLTAAGAPAGRLDTHVRAIMRAGVISVPDDASMRQIQRALVSHRVHAVLVVSVKGAQPVGWATTRGVLEHMRADLGLLPAALAVTEPAETIFPSATAEDARRRLIETGCARLLVSRDSGAPPEGVLSEMDLVRLTTPT